MRYVAVILETDRQFPATCSGLRGSFAPIPAAQSRKSESRKRTFRAAKAHGDLWWKGEGDGLLLEAIRRWRERIYV
jgi:hypothetical protein